MNTTSSSTDTIKNIANDVIDTAEEKTFETLETTRQAANKVADKAGTLEQDISQSVTTLADTVTQYVNEKPINAAGIAFAAGIVATLLLTRR